MKNYYFILHILLYLSVLNISCSRESSHSFSKKVRNDGVEICVNKKTPLYDTPIYDIRETLSLGGESHVPKLYQSYNFFVDNDGCLYFTDEKRVKKFDSEGNFLFLIGDRGDGPGEIKNPRLITIIDNILFVGESSWRGNRKYELFKLDGKFIRRMYAPTIKMKLING